MSEFAKALGDIAAGYAAIAAAFENLSNAVKQDMKEQAADAAKAEKAKAEAAQAESKEKVETEEPEVKFVKSDKPAPPIEEVKKTAENISTPMKKEIVREILSTLSKNGHTGDVKNLLNKYGTGKLSSVDPKDYVALVKDAQAISDNAA